MLFNLCNKNTVLKIVFISSLHIELKFYEIITCRCVLVLENYINIADIYILRTSGVRKTCRW